MGSEKNHKGKEEVDWVKGHMLLPTPHLFGGQTKTFTDSDLSKAEGSFPKTPAGKVSYSSIINTTTVLPIWGFLNKDAESSYSLTGCLVEVSTNQAHQ